MIVSDEGYIKEAAPEELATHLLDDGQFARRLLLSNPLETSALALLDRDDKNGNGRRGLVRRSIWSSE